MVASASHDMRTPLNTIKSMQTLIEQRISDPVLRKWLSIAKTSTNLLLYLVNDSLDYYQIKSNKFSQKIGPFSIKQVVNDCFSLISAQME